MLSLCLTFQAENAAGEARFDPGGCPLLRVKPLEERGLKPKDVSVAVWPTGLLDESQTHYLTQGTPTIAILAVANPLRRNLLRAWVVADIPEGVELVGVNQYLVWHLRKSEKTRRDGQPYQRFEFPCNVHPTTIPRGEQRGCWYGLYRPAALWLRTDLPEGSQPGKLFLRFRYEEKYETELPGNLDPAKAGAEDGGTEAEDDAGEPSERKKPKPTPQSEESFVHLAVLKPLSANQPKLARSGVMGRFIFNWNASQPEMPQRLADTLKQLGYNYVVTFMRWPGGTPDLGFWAEMGIQNGFEVSLGEPIPAAIRFLAAGQEVENAVTPSAIYGRDPLVEKHVFAPLRETVKAKTLSAVCANWEPYRLLSTGCESERSRDEFIRWSKLPADEVKAEWPDGVRAKRLKLYREFLNWQLGQVTKTLAETVSEAGKATGVESRMTFWMSNDALQNPPDNLLESPISVQAWGDVPCNLLTWNYYYVPKAESAKPEIDRFGAPQVVRSGALTRHLDRIFGQNRQMRLGCLYGFDQTGGYGYFLPEQVGFLHLSTVLAGMAIAQNYAEWPVWDGRYAQEIARANTRIARWEEFVLKGEKTRQHVVIPVSPYPQVVPETVKPADQELKGDWEHPGYLFSFEYRLGNRRLVAVANTWDHGECFFRLRLLDLKADAAYVLLEPDENRRFAAPGAESGILTGQALEDGVTVHVGATRWAAFLVEPFQDGQAYPTVAQPAEVAATLANRRPGLEDRLNRRDARE